MSDEGDRGFFERLGEILNAPPSGIDRSGTRKNTEGTIEDDEDSLLDRVKDILNQPLPGTEIPRNAETPPVDTGGKGGKPARSGAAPQQSPGLDADDLDEDWWGRDWDAFRQHQKRKRQGFNTKQRGDQKRSTRYQKQERTRFDTHQKQDWWC